MNAKENRARLARLRADEDLKAQQPALRSFEDINYAIKMVGAAPRSVQRPGKKSKSKPK